MCFGCALNVHCSFINHSGHRAQSPHSIQASALVKLQRPCAMIKLEGYPTPFPADIHCVMRVQMDELVPPTTHDLVYVQFYEHVFGTPEDPLRHPFVPAAACYYLDDTFDIVGIDTIVGMVRMVPSFRPDSAREPKEIKKVSSSSTGGHRRPIVFALSAVL